MVLLKEQYGKQVVVNLLGSRGGEEVLNRAFKVMLKLLSQRWGWGGEGQWWKEREWSEACSCGRALGSGGPAHVHTPHGQRGCPCSPEELSSRPEQKGKPSIILTSQRPRLPVPRSSVPGCCSEPLAPKQTHGASFCLDHPQDSWSYIWAAREAMCQLLAGLLLIPECQTVPSSKQIPVPSRVDLSRVRKQ